MLRPAGHPTPTARIGGWMTTLVVALIASVPALLAFATFGLIETPDSPGYLAYSEMLRAGPLPEGEALLRSSPAPVALMRTAGYPVVLVALQALAPQAWPLLLVALQVAGQAAIAALAYRTGLVLGLRPWLAALAALMPATGFSVVVQIALLTDALYATLVTGAALALLHGALTGGGLRRLALAGGLLGLATFMREATPFLALGFLPAAAILAGRGRRLLGMGLVLAPVLLATAWLLADNARRSGHAILSTTRQIVMVQAVLPLLERGVPVYDGDDLFDRTVRETVVGVGYRGIDEMHARLFRAGMTAPEMAALASDRYWRAWRRYPMEMLRGMMVRFPIKILAGTFQPVDTVAELPRQIGLPRPAYGQPALLWQDVAGGSALALLILLALVGGRSIGYATGLLALVAPLLLARHDSRRLPLLGTWLICAVFIMVYLPVHLEQRYLVPIIPLTCLLGVVGAQAVWARRRPPTRSATLSLQDGQRA